MMWTDDRPYVPCGLCGTPTPMTGTKRCDRCWELESRIHGDPALAQKILDGMNSNKKQEVIFWEGFLAGYKRALWDLKAKITEFETVNNPFTNVCSKLEQTEGSAYDENEEIKAGGTD